MFIHNASTFLSAPLDVKALKEELKRHTDIYFRRVNKFVLLALIGAQTALGLAQVWRAGSA